LSDRLGLIDSEGFSFLIHY